MKLKNKSKEALPSLTISQATQQLRAGGVIAYPTEAVYGLGCCPLNQIAVLKLLDLKSRSIDKGLILISDHFECLKPYLDLSVLSSAQIDRALLTWPGHYTWIFPASHLVPAWIKGDFSGVAVRVTKHPVAAQLCHAWGGALVSTSANVGGALPARNRQAILTHFPSGLGGVVRGALGGAVMPSAIQDVRTGFILRM